MATTPPSDSPLLRNILAIDRTVMASERTLLSYVRTALALVGGGVGLIKFFDGAWRIAGVVAIALGVGLAVWGAVRFTVVARRLRAVRRSEAGQEEGPAGQGGPASID